MVHSKAAVFMLVITGSQAVMCGVVVVVVGAADGTVLGYTFKRSSLLWLWCKRRAKFTVLFLT